MGATKYSIFPKYNVIELGFQLYFLGIPTYVLQLMELCYLTLP